MVKKLINFIQRDVWRIRLAKTSRRQSFFIKNLRIILLALRGFNEDKCSLRASALTFYSLLSIVPVFAMAFGIAKGFGLDKLLENQIIEKLPAQSDVVVNVINFSRTLLDNTKGGVVAGFGVALLFWTIIKVLGNIEHSFNDIWGIKKMRPWGRRFSDYLSVVLICPVLFILASGITVFAKTQAILITEKIAILGAIAPLITLLVDLLPFTVVWVLFTFIYIFMPNTKVNIKSALLAGVVAGTIYQLTQWVYVDFQVGVAKANAIYGSFAALPLFLVWLQLSWRIVLLGAEVSFAHQNVDTYEFEPDCLNVSHSFKQLLSLRVVNLLAKNFSEGKAALSAAQISHELEIPIRLVRDIIFELTESGIVSTITQEKAPVYQPALDVNLLTIRYVIGKLNSRGSDNIPVVESREIKRIAESLKKFAELVSGSPENLCLKEI